LELAFPLLFRLVAIEDAMGKSLTGGGSRRYLWASFVVCVGRQPGQERKKPELKKREGWSWERIGEQGEKVVAWRFA